MGVNGKSAGFRFAAGLRMPGLFAGAQFCFKRSLLAKTADAENIEPYDLSLLVDSLLKGSWDAALVRKIAYGRGVTIVRIAGAKPVAACGGRVSAIGYFGGAAGGPAGAVAVPGVGTTTPGASGSSSTAVTRVT